MWQASHLCPVLKYMCFLYLYLRCYLYMYLHLYTSGFGCVTTKTVVAGIRVGSNRLEQHTHHNVTPYLYLYFYLYLYLYLRLCLRLCFYWNPCQQQLACRSILIARKYHPPVGLFCVVSISCLLGCGRGCLLHYISNKQWFAYKSPSQFTSTDQKNYFQHIFTHDNAC